MAFWMILGMYAIEVDKKAVGLTIGVCRRPGFWFIIGVCDLGLRVWYFNMVKIVVFMIHDS